MGRERVQAGAAQRGVEPRIYQVLFEASPFAILIADDRGRYVDANAQACVVFGVSREQLVGKTVYDFVAPEDIAPTRARWASFRDERAQSGEFPLMRGDGSRRLLRYHAIAEVEPQRHASFLEDITDLAAARRARQEAEAERDRFLELSADIICVIDSERRFLRVNPAFERILGHPPADVIGRDYLELVHPDDVVAILAARRSVDEGRPATGFAARFRHRDGSYRWISWSSTAHEDRHFIVGRDVTDEKRARDALELSEAHFRTLVDGVPVTIWIGDADGRSIYYNRHWFAYTGLNAGDAARPDDELLIKAIHPDDTAQVMPRLAEAREQRAPVKIVFRLRRHDGTYRWHLARSTPVLDPNGATIRRVGCATDIEDERRALESLRLEREQRERFVAALSHDLRSPLHAVKLAAQLVTMKATDAEVCRTQSRRILRNVAHADALIQNLLDASRLSAGEKLTVNRAPCDVTALVRDVIEEQSATHGDRFEVDAPPGIAAEVDATAIRRALENLIANAVKYGDRHLPVHIAVRPGEHSLDLEVHNHGNPIAAEDQGRIFQPFQRVRQTGTTTAGWGLGLTAVRGIAEAHGGSVRVSSSPDDGTRFVVTLPA